jgi:hypothetical protein
MISSAEFVPAIARGTTLAGYGSLSAPVRRALGA